MALDDRARDDEAEARAGDCAPPRARGAVEAGEQLAELLGRHADARVGDLDPQRAVAVRGRQRHRAAARRELERVRDEVVEDLPEPRGVGFQREAALDVEAELDPALSGHGQGVLDGRGRQLGEVGRREPELEQLRLDLRDQEEVARRCGGGGRCRDG